MSDREQTTIDLAAIEAAAESARAELVKLIGNTPSGDLNCLAWKRVTGTLRGELYMERAWREKCANAK